MEALPRDLVFTRQDRSQVLVTLWADGHATMAERADSGDTWGPPVPTSFDTSAINAMGVPEKRQEPPMTADERAILREVDRELHKALGDEDG